MARRKRRRKKKNQPTIVSSQTMQSPVSSKDWQHHYALLQKEQANNRLVTNEGLFGRSFKSSSCHQISAKELLRIAETPLFASAISQIANGILRLEYEIILPESTPFNLEIKADIERALKHPNCQHNNQLTKFLQAVVRNLLIFNVAPVERQVGSDNFDSQDFWFWDVSPLKIHLNPAWTPQANDTVPRYYAMQQRGYKKQYQPIMDENLFLIQHRTSSESTIPKSPIEIAYNIMRQWLGLSDYQERIVENGIKDYVLAIEGSSQKQIDQLRAYWQTEVEGSGKLPIISGKASVLKIGAKSDDEMFLEFQKHLTALIALSFNLNVQDYNIQQSTGQNRATAEVHDNRSFFNAILPIGQCIYDSLDRELVDFYNPGFCLKLTTLEPSSKTKKKTEAKAAFESGGISLNEYRRRLGEVELEGGEVFRLGNQLLLFDERGGFQVITSQLSATSLE